MVRNLKSLGLIILAAFALSALAASAAQAEKYTAEKYPATLSGAASTHTLNFEGHKYECAKTTFSGELKEASESVKLTPTYSECTMGGKKGITIATCKKGLIHFDFVKSTFTSCEEGYVHIVRVFKTGTEEVECEYEVGLISGEELTHNNLEGTQGIELTWNIKGITYKLLQGGLLVCGPAEGKATYTGTSVISATNEGKAIKFDIG
jgi:hypothetical protein